MALSVGKGWGGREERGTKGRPRITPRAQHGAWRLGVQPFTQGARAPDTLGLIRAGAVQLGPRPLQRGGIGSGEGRGREGERKEAGQEEEEKKGRRKTGTEEDRQAEREGKKGRGEENTGLLVTGTE